jgi:hypothetical protein
LLRRRAEAGLLDEYRTRAAECERIAAAVSGQTVRDEYLDMAAQWRRLAEHAAMHRDADMLRAEKPE